MSKRQPTRTTHPSTKKWMKQTGVNTLLISTALLSGIWSLRAHAVPVTAPVSGEIEEITVNDINDHWSGGVIVAGGQNIIIPKNLLIDLPANRVTLQQLFTEASSSCKTQQETGLAKGDACNASGTGGIATIQATRLENGHVIAGDVFIAKAAETVIGQITFISYDQGYFRVNGNANVDNGGVMVRLNDPDGRHTIQSGLGCATNSLNCSADPRFTLDGDNYTNVFSTGYPMCIPSTVPRAFTDTLGLGVTTSQADSNGANDVLCPTTNRTISNGQPVDDSRRFAPILLGDSIMAEGNYEEVNGVRFLSAHSTAVSAALSTKLNDPTQPDYLFLDEVEIDVPGFQNQRARTLIIGYATLAPADIMIWSIHYNPKTNSPHEFPLATTTGCDVAGGPGTCTAQGLVGAGANIFKIRHDVDFLVGAKPKVNPCSHLQGDPRFATLTPCAAEGGSIAEQLAILSPIPHEIQARTGRKFADMTSGNPQLITLDIKGNEATNGQYLFPFGMGLGGISTPEMNEINLDAMATPLSFSGIPWNLDRRLSPGGCLDNNNDGIGECENSPQPLDPFPFEGTNMDPRTLGSLPSGTYSDPNYVAGTLSDVRNRILSYIDPNASRLGGNGIGVNDNGNFTTAILDWNTHSTAHALPPSTGPGSGHISSSPALPQALICSANSAFNSPPVAHDDSDTTDTDLAKTISVLWNDSDVNNDTLSVTGVSSSVNAVVGTGTPTSQGGTADLNLDGTITFTPAPGFSGVDTFIYTVSDGTDTTTGTVSVTVNATSNTPPLAVDDPVSILEDSGAAQIDVLFNDTDDNSGTGGGVLSIASVTSPANGTVLVSGNASINGDQKVTYTPKPNFNGMDTFTYIVADGQGGTATATVSVTVAPINDAPVAVNEIATVAQGTSMIINVLDNDTDVDVGDHLTISTVTPSEAPLGVVTVSNGGATVNYAANPGAVGDDTFTYTITDGSATATATVAVKVIAPAVDNIGITRAQFTISKSEWRIEGTGDVPGKTITVRLGTSNTGGLVGSATVDTLGAWIVRVKPGLQPGGNTSVTAWSSGNGKQTIAFILK